MKRIYFRLLAALLALLMLLTGCHTTPERQTEAQTVPTEVTETTEPTVPPTTPEDGDPDDATCKGSYTVEDSVLQAEADTVVATVAEQELTVSQLQIYYWLEVAQYRSGGYETGPDFDRPLDTQVCQIDSSVNSWQQYFLKRALTSWHTQTALVLQGQINGVPTEEAYQPDQKKHEEYLTEKPATKVLYGYNESYQPNSQHQAYLDAIPQMLEQLAQDKGLSGTAELAEALAGTAVSEQSLQTYTELYNRAYMYFTELHYDVDNPTAEEVTQWYLQDEQTYSGKTGSTINVRHILLVPEVEEPEPTPSWVQTEPEDEVPQETVHVAQDGTVTCSEELWEACRLRAEQLLEQWAADSKSSEATFADLAHKNSADAGSSKNGGLYSGLVEGQLAQELNDWCFDEARQSGDTEIIRTKWGYHILYFSGKTDNGYAAAEDDWITNQDGGLISTCRSAFPMTVDYSAICLGVQGNSAGVVAAQDLLYPDVAHQRFPDVPLYLQQDYPTTKYGAYRIVTHGCGITTLAMLASYMADDSLTPPMMCERFSKYSYSTGTDGSLFNEAPAQMNFYLQEKTFDWRVAKEALEEGHIVVVVQQKGYWTRGGHYLVLEKTVEDGRVQVRDSNIYNYGKLHDHKKDSFTWSCITPAGMAYWIYDYKRVDIPECWRCGDETTEGLIDGLLTMDYTCEKCSAAMLRRNNFLTLSGE